MSVTIYKVGFVHLSVCAPREMPREEVEAAVNAQHPTGLDHGWTVSDEQTFSGGEPHPYDAPDCGRHWLMVC